MLFLTQSQHMRWENFCRGDGHPLSCCRTCVITGPIFMVNAAFEPLFEGWESRSVLIVSEGFEGLRKNGGCNGWG